MSARTWFVYLLECVDGSFYTGIATDVAARLAAHEAAKGARYTRSHKPLRLLASAPVGSKSQALKAELAIKRLPKEQKLLAVQSLASQISHQPERSPSMNKSELIEAIASAARPGDQVLVMSNGGFGGIHDKLLQRLAHS